jgi:hypothetical protein
VRRAAVPVLAAVCAAALGLAACPLPQPLASVGREDGGTITPPRILVDTALPAGTTISVGTQCPAPAFLASATLDDQDTDEPVDVRWFFDYAPSPPNDGIQSLEQLAGTETGETQRQVTPFCARLPPWTAGAAPAHVLEMVVSNGFYDPVADPGPTPNRTPRPGFETQAYRWVFVYADSASCGDCP